jgi:protein FrlC
MLNQLAATNMVYARFSFHYFLESMQRLGVHRIELYGCSPHFHFYDTDGDPTPKVKKQILDAGLQIISVMPEENVYPVNIGAKEKGLRQKTIELYKRFITATAELNCPQMLLCPGRPYRDQPFSEGYGYSRDSIEQLVRYAENENVVLLYENLHIGETHLATKLEDQYRMVADIDSPYLKFCVDTVPVYAAGEKLEAYFVRMGDRLAHIHLNDGRPTGHLKWGDGTQNLDEHLNAMRNHNYTGYITMEMAADRYRMDPEKYYAENIEYLRPHFDGGEL